MHRILFAQTTRSIVLAVVGLAALGCGGGKASMKAGASGEASTAGGTKAKANADRSWEYSDDSVEDAPTAAKVGDATEKSTGVKPSVAAAPTPSTEPALLGARRDLVLSKGVQPNCECLAVVAGKPGNTWFTWNGPMPQLDETSQLVVAVGSEGIPCAKSSTGASYMGYREEGEGVIISVEAAHAGRPITHGAIIPKPKNGQILVEGVGKIPYGRGADGAARCKLSVQ